MIFMYYAFTVPLLDSYLLSAASALLADQNVNVFIDLQFHNQSGLGPLAGAKTCGTHSTTSTHGDDPVLYRE